MLQSDFQFVSLQFLFFILLLVTWFGLSVVRSHFKVRQFHHRSLSDVAVIFRKIYSENENGERDVHAMG